MRRGRVTMVGGIRTMVGVWKIKNKIICTRPGVRARGGIDNKYFIIYTLVRPPSTSTYVRKIKDGEVPNTTNFGQVAESSEI